MDAEAKNEESYPPPAKKQKHGVMRGREHERRRQRPCPSYDDDQGQGPAGSSHAKDNEEEASETSSPPPEGNKGACHDRNLFEFSDVMLARLSEIRASAVRFVDMKRLQTSDVRVNQNRLEFPERSPISRIFTDAEKAQVRTSDGMSVTAFDLQGQRYEMTCKLWRDKHYRFMGQGWKNFREAHHLTIAKEARLTRRITVKLWKFRSRALLPEEVRDDGEEEPAGDDPDDGALGLVVLLFEDEVARDESRATKRSKTTSAETIDQTVPKFHELAGAVGLWLLETWND